MRIKFLNTLVTVLHHPSQVSAARALNLTPSAVSLQIKQLEKYFGRQLFDRSGRDVRPTPFAMEVAAVMSPALDGLERLRERDPLSLAGQLRLGSIESVQLGLLPQSLQNVRLTAPKLQLQVTRAVSDELIASLKSGALDCAVLVKPPTGRSHRLLFHQLKEEKYVMIAPLQSKGSTPKELLAQHGWIRLDRATTGGRIAAQYVESIAPHARRTFDLPSSDAIVAMVSAGVGVSVLPDHRRELGELYPVRRIPLGRNAPVRHIAFACRAADQDNRKILTVLRAFQLAAQVQEERARR